MRPNLSRLSEAFAIREATLREKRKSGESDVRLGYQQKLICVCDTYVAFVWLLAPHFVFCLVFTVSDPAGFYISRVTLSSSS